MEDQVTPGDLAEMLGLSRQRVDQLWRAGEIPPGQVLKSNGKVICRYWTKEQARAIQKARKG